MVARQFEAVLGTLSPEFREVLILVDVQDLNYQEIAEVLDVPLGTVNPGIASARHDASSDAKNNHVARKNWLLTALFAENIAIITGLPHGHRRQNRLKSADDPNALLGVRQQIPFRPRGR